MVHPRVGYICLAGEERWPCESSFTRPLTSLRPAWKGCRVTRGTGGQLGPRHLLLNGCKVVRGAELHVEVTVPRD